MVSTGHRFYLTPSGSTIKLEVRPQERSASTPVDVRPPLPSPNPSDIQEHILGSGKLLRWRRGRILGRGAFGEVFQCLNTGVAARRHPSYAGADTGEILAVKIVNVPRSSHAFQAVNRENERRRSSGDLANSLKREVELMGTSGLSRCGGGST